MLLPIKRNRTLLCVALTLALLALPTVGSACNYGKHGLGPGEPVPATVDKLFSGQYDERKEWKTADWRLEVEAIQDLATDVPGKLSLAWALHMAGQNNKALPIYQQILRATPDHYETLCSYATVLHAMRQYAPAREALSKAIALKPGYRNRAEEFHLSMINFEEKSKSNFQYAKDNIFIEALTPLWKNRKGVDENFSTVDFPAGYTSDGVAELLRQYPLNGEAWMALGMMLEHEEDFSMAAKAYDRALERGTAHAPELKKYMTTFRDFGRSQDPGRMVGRRVIQMGILIGVLVVLWIVGSIIRRVVWDITSVRARKEEEKRRQRRNNKDNDGPL